MSPDRREVGLQAPGPLVAIGLAIVLAMWGCAQGTDPADQGLLPLSTQDASPGQGTADDGGAPDDAEPDATTAATADAGALPADASTSTTDGGSGAEASTTTDTGASTSACTTSLQCSAGDLCVAGSCVHCTPTTCTAENATCGTIPDGCGGTLSCGSCTAPQTCGGGSSPSTCGCTPTTCSAQGANCGTIPDGCGGTLTCGSCTAPETCGTTSKPNVCAVPCGILPDGGTLEPGQSLSSCDGRFTLIMQATDGNLVVYFNGVGALWDSDTEGNPGAFAIMQGDGNFVVYLGTTALWDSQTYGNPGAFLDMQTDGNLVVYGPGDVPLWASGTGGH